MANYAMMRCKKLVEMGSVTSAFQRCYREREMPNADAERTPKNEYDVSESTDQAMDRLRDLLLCVTEPFKGLHQDQMQEIFRMSKIFQQENRESELEKRIKSEIHKKSRGYGDFER